MTSIRMLSYSSAELVTELLIHSRGLPSLMESMMLNLHCIVFCRRFAYLPDCPAESVVWSLGYYPQRFAMMRVFCVHKESLEDQHFCHLRARIAEWVRVCILEDLFLCSSFGLEQVILMQVSGLTNRFS